MKLRWIYEQTYLNYQIQTQYKKLIQLSSSIAVQPGVCGCELLANVFCYALNFTSTKRHGPKLLQSTSESRAETELTVCGAQLNRAEHG